MSGNQEYPAHLSDTDKIDRNLRADCDKCFGFCCVALYFSASEGFPINKDAGQPCPNLQTDFRCGVHKNLSKSGLKGCIAYDCFGAGQKVAQITYGGHDWRQFPESAQQMFEVFLIMRQLHELLWYLNKALTLQPAHSIHGALNSTLDETKRLTHLSSDDLIKLDLAAHQADVNNLLLQTSELVRTEILRGQNVVLSGQKTLGSGIDLIGADLRRINLRGANLRGAYLIAADLREADLNGTDFIGADFRNTDLSGADLTRSIFVTQSQINVAKGDSRTKLPASLTRPSHWPQA